MTIDEDIKQLAPWTESLPNGWEATRLDAVADVFFSNVDKHTIDGETPVRLCNYVDVYKNERITGAIDFMEASADQREVKKFQIQWGDVLVTKDSEEPEYIAIPSFVSEELPGVLCGYHLSMIRPRSSSVYGLYLAWLHASKSFRAQYEARAVGVTRFGLSQYAFRAARIPLPPLPEQQRIAAYLDASCAAIDAAMVAKRRQIETLDAVHDAIIEYAVTRGLRPNAPTRAVNEDWITDIPAHWDVCRIKRVVSRVDYGISERTEPEGRYPVLKMGHIQRGEIQFRDLDFVDYVENDLLLETGDLLYNRTNSPDQVGKAAIFRRSRSDAVTFASYLVRLRTNHRADAYFLNYLVNSIGFLSFARKLAIPSVQQSNLNSTRYFVMHEYEGLLFSDCAAFAEAIAQPRLAQRFREIRQQFATPEEINDSPITAPSKRVEGLFVGYQKPLFGTLAAEKMGLVTIRNECPHFRDWLDRLEAWPKRYGT